MGKRVIQVNKNEYFCDICGSIEGKGRLSYNKCKKCNNEVCDKCIGYSRGVIMFSQIFSDRILDGTECPDVVICKTCLETNEELRNKIIKHERDAKIYRNRNGLSDHTQDFRLEKMISNFLEKL